MVRRDAKSYWTPRVCLATNASLGWQKLFHERNNHHREKLLLASCLMVFIWLTSRLISTKYTFDASYSDQSISSDVRESELLEDMTSGNAITTPGYRFFFNEFFSVLENSIVNDEPFSVGMSAYKHHENVFKDHSKKRILELQSFDKRTLEKLKTIHNHVVSQIPELMEVDHFSGIGYVTVGGGANDFLAVLLTEQLRATGSQYPIEVMIPPSYDFDTHICESVLPKLGASCVKMNDVFGVKTLKKLRYNPQLIQTLAVVGSSFEKVFFLSPNTIPLHNPDKVLSSNLFEEYGLILWPSLYRNTISPAYYEIAGINVEEIRVRTLNDRWTPLEMYEKFKMKYPHQPKPFAQNFHDMKGAVSEFSTTGDLYAIDKSRHMDVLLLSLYYTNDGPGRYFPMLNLASYKSNGDYLSASAHFFRKPYYQLFKIAEKIGEQTRDDDFFLGHSAVTAFYNPIEDYELLMGQLNRLRTDLESGDDMIDFDYHKNFRASFSVFTSTPLFFHVEEPGLDPFKVRAAGKCTSKEEPHKRIYGKHIKFYGADFEYNINACIFSMLCREETKIKFEMLEPFETDILCKDFLEGRLKYLDETSATYWNRYKFEKRKPLPVPDNLKPSIEYLIRSGFQSDTNYHRIDIERIKKVKL